MKLLLLLLTSWAALAQVTSIPSAQGGGTAAPPYSAAFSAVTTLTVTAATHGLGTTPVASDCWDNGTPRLLIAQTAGYPQINASGDVTWAWTGSKTGACYIFNSSASGAAGGDLTGTYPNPTIANNAVTSAKILSDAVTTAKILDGNVTTAKILDANVTMPKIAADVDFTTKTSTAPNKSGTAPPGTCTVGQTFFDTDAAAGQNLYGCTATNTWTLLGDGGSGSSAFSSLTGGTNTTAAMVAGAGSSFRANAADATAPSKSGTSLPGTCTVGDTYVKTDATAAAQLHLCTATNVWTQQVGTGGGSSYPLAENAQSGSTYTLVTGDCGKLVVLTFAGSTTVTVPAASGFANTCEIQIMPTGGNATLQTGVSATVYDDQTAVLRSNASVWRVDYLQFTSSGSGAVVPVRGTDGTTNFELDQTINYTFSGANTVSVGETGNLRFTGTNNGTGTVANRLAKLAAGNTLTVMATSDTDEPLGVCLSGCGNSGTAVIAFRGNVLVEADNPVNPNDWIIVGTTTAGRARSNGATRPTSGFSLGRARTGASAGSTFTLLLNVEGVSSGGSANAVLSTSTFGTDNKALRSDGTGRDAQSSLVTIDDSGNVSTTGTMTAASFSGGGTTEGNLTLTEASGNGSNFRRLTVPAALTADLTFRYPNTLPSGSVMLWPTPSSDISEATFTSPVGLGGALYCADAGGSDAYACSLSPAITSYVTGTHYFFRANTSNTGAATINLNSVGAATIKKFTSASPGADLADSDIRAGQIVEVVYDGTNMQMVSALGNAGGGSSAFSAITGGTNTGAAMVVGAGASHRANAADATAPSKSGTSLPGTCTVGDTYIKTDNPTPIQLYICTATNTWTVQGDDIFDFTTMRVQERFCGSSVAAGPTSDVGQYRWNSDAIAGTSTFTVAADVNHPCYWQIVTGSTSGNGSTVRPFYYTSQPHFQFAYGNAANWEMRLLIQIDTITDTDFAFGVGTGSTDFTTLGTNVIRIKRLAGGGTFVFEGCDGSTCSSSNSTITPANATTHTLRIRSTTAGTILFSVDGETEISRSTNITTSTLVPRITIKTATAATRQLRLFGWAFQKTGMTP